MIDVFADPLFGGFLWNLATEQSYLRNLESRVRSKLRNMSTDQLVKMLDRYDFRIAQIVKDKMGSPYGWNYDGNKLRMMNQLPELNSIKALTEKLRNLDTGGSLVETMRLMVMVAILEHLTRQLQGLIG